MKQMNKIDGNPKAVSEKGCVASNELSNNSPCIHYSMLHLPKW